MAHIYTSEETNDMIKKIKLKNPNFSHSGFFKMRIEEYYQKELVGSLDIAYIEGRLREIIKEQKKIAEEKKHFKDLLEKAKKKTKEERLIKKGVEKKEAKKMEELYKNTLDNIGLFFEIIDEDEIKRLAKEFVSIPQGSRDTLFDFMKNKGYGMEESKDETKKLKNEIKKI